MASPSFSFYSSLLSSSSSSSSSSWPRVSIPYFSLRALPLPPSPSTSRRRRRRLRLGRSSSFPPGGSSLGDGNSNHISCSVRCSESSARRRFISLGALAILLPQLQVAQGVEYDEASAIRNGLRSVLSKAKAAGMLRLAFHDAGTFDTDGDSGGMNGSIIYELERPENAGLNKSVKILEKARKEIENIQQVSWADLIAVAGAEAVSMCGGPVIPIRLGRLDSRIADPQGKLPQESLDASGLKSCFQKKGFSWIRIYAADQDKFFNDFKNTYIKLVNCGASWKNT